MNDEANESQKDIGILSTIFANLSKSLNYFKRKSSEEKKHELNLTETDKY